MNPVSALVLFGLPLGIFSFADSLGNKASNVLPRESGKSQRAVVTNTGENRRQAMQLCAA
jgi:hypothetical protein